MSAWLIAAVVFGAWASVCLVTIALAVAAKRGDEADHERHLDEQAREREHSPGDR